MSGKRGWKSSAEKGKTCIGVLADVLRSNYGVEKLYSVLNGACEMKRQISGFVIQIKESLRAVLMQGVIHRFGTASAGDNDKEGRARGYLNNSHINLHRKYGEQTFLLKLLRFTSAELMLNL